MDVIDLSQSESDDVSLASANGDRFSSAFTSADSSPRGNSGGSGGGSSSSGHSRDADGVGRRSGSDGVPELVPEREVIVDLRRGVAVTLDPVANAVNVDRVSSDRRFRAACFTLNNPTDVELAKFSTPIAGLRYFVFLRERAPTTGTVHVQGYAYSNAAKSLSAWKTIFGTRAHVEGARGSPQQNRDYCTKETSREEGTEPVEWGELPNQGMFAPPNFYGSYSSV